MAGGALQDHIEDQASRLGTKLKIRVRLRSFESMCQMAGAGAGVGIIPETAARRWQRSTSIAIIRLRDEWAIRRLSLCIRNESDLTVPAKALFDHLSMAAE
jgi:DNA-binding transcriptional LysR family regulator